MNQNPNIEKDLFSEAVELPPDQREIDSIMSDRFSGRLAHCPVNLPAVAGSEIEQQLNEVQAQDA